MKTKTTEELIQASGGIARLFGNRFGRQIMLDKEDGTGNDTVDGGNDTLDGGDDEAAKEAAAKEAAEKAAAADKAAKEKAEKEAIEEEERKRGSKLTDREAELLKENMARKKAQKDLEDRLKAFEGVDPAEWRKIKDNERKAKEAEEKAKLEAAEKAGEFTRVKKIMAEQHDAALKAKDADLAKANSALEAAMRTIEELTVGSSFSASTFIAQETVLTPTIARATFGSHFDIVDGKVVAYDKPRGAKDRTPMVDAAGEAVPFETAIKRLVESNPEKDKLLRSQMAPGTGSRTENNTLSGKSTFKPSHVDTGARGVNRMKAALDSGALKEAPIV